MNIPADLNYTKNDEWLKLINNSGTIGITDFAQEQLSDIVYVDLVVSIGDEVVKDDQIATIESVKAAADVYTPVSGKVVSINEILPDQPEILNHDPYGQGWIIVVEVADVADNQSLMDAIEYAARLKEKE